MVKCPRCEGSSFALRSISPSGSRFQYNVIACASCSTGIGAVDPIMAGAAIEEVKQKLEKIERTLDDIRVRLR